MKTAARSAWLSLAFLATLPLSAQEFPAEGETLGRQARTFVLRRAMRRFHRPNFWAAFGLQGDWR